MATINYSENKNVRESDALPDGYEWNERDSYDEDNERWDDEKENGRNEGHEKEDEEVTFSPQSLEPVEIIIENSPAPESCIVPSIWSIWPI